MLYKKNTYLCHYEKENDLDHSHHHGIVLPCLALSPAKIYTGDG